MTEPMTLERFAGLAEAYGGAVARWPAADRDAAMAMAATPMAVAILAQASMLDDMLDAWRVPAPSDRLRTTLSAAVPTRAPTRARFWWSGIGIAATLAGATAGVTAVALLAPVDMSTDTATSFGDLAAQEG